MLSIEMEAAMACRRMTDDAVGIDGGVRSPPRVDAREAISRRAKAARWR